MPELERRSFELRHDELENRIVSGTAIKFGDIANIAGVFRERFEPDSLKLSDPVMNVQHDRGRLVARKGAGLNVLSDSSSIQIRAQLPQTRIADDALEMISAGLLRGLSIEFQVRGDSWTDDDVPLRTVTDAELTGVAIVDRPAYPQSTLDREARSILAAYKKHDHPRQTRRWYL